GKSGWIPVRVLPSDVALKVGQGHSGDAACRVLADQRAEEEVDDEAVRVDLLPTEVPGPGGRQGAVGRRDVAGTKKISEPLGRQLPQDRTEGARDLPEVIRIDRRHAHQGVELGDRGPLVRTVVSVVLEEEVG